ncbi:MAG: M20/M25/M40 family metallo-hydrolase, partial [Acidobacteriota bacterium]
WLGSPEAEAVASQVIGIALVESHAHDKLAHLTDRIGARLSGSPQLDEAVKWAAAEFTRDGLHPVWRERVMVPHWRRGDEAAWVVSPVRRKMALTTLGGSVGTPEGGLRAEVIEVHGFEELEAAGEAVRGKFVLFAHEMRRNGQDEFGYGNGARMRVAGPVEAAKRGAVGMLIRSLGTASYRLPHTGMTRYADDVDKIPAAALAVEDALLIHRLLAAGERVEVELTLGAKMLPDAPSANVLAELRGRERPDEVVVIGGHLDSWDVGAGAIDDGAGCAIVMESLRLLAKHHLVPRRTIRAVLFTNEENGLRGGRDYAKRHEDEMPNHVAAIESDSGGGTPLGFRVTSGEGGAEVVQRIARYLSVIGADEVGSPGGGADVGQMQRFGVPLLGLRPDTTYYFDYHHTDADTLDKVNRADLDRQVAAMMWMAYALAEIDTPLPRVPPGADSGE